MKEPTNPSHEDIGLGSPMPPVDGMACSEQGRVESHPSGVFCVEQVLILRMQQKNGGKKRDDFFAEGKLKAQA